MNTAPQSSPASLLRLIIAETAAAAPPTVGVPHDSEAQNRLKQEVQELAGSNKNLEEALFALFPNGVPNDLTFYGRLMQLYKRLGSGELAQRLVGFMWTAGLQNHSHEKRENLLALFMAVENPDFFSLLASLRHVFERVSLDAKFAAGWLQSIVKRIGNDLAAGSFWDSLAAYCDNQIGNALNVLQRLSNPDTEPGVAVAAHILGTLRALPLAGEHKTDFLRCESWLATSSTSHPRRIYLRSWIQTIWRGKGTRADLECLAAHVEVGVQEEEQEAFFVFTRLPLIPNLHPDLFAFAIDWLNRKTSPNISPAAKHHVVELSVLLLASGRQDAGDLLLLIQPIPRENKGTWAQLEIYLVSLLQKDLPAFMSFCTKLAARNASGWLKVMQEPGCFEWLLGEMRGKEIGRLVGELALSLDENSRKLALFLFDELDLVSLPGPLLESANERELKLAVYEVQRNLMHGKAIARFLVSVIKNAVKAPKELQQEICEELVLQSKNFGGQCRGELGKHAAELPLVKEALDAAERYYDGLRQVQDSPITQMDVPGFRQASRLSGRRFSEGVSKGAREASTFLRLFKHVQLLYGKQWRSFQNGSLGQASELQAISSSIEIPRLELIDPEGMALHRLQASVSIVNFNSTGSEAQSEQ